MKKTVKLLALALALCVLFGALPLSVSAAETCSMITNYNSSCGLVREQNNRTSFTPGEYVSIFVIPRDGMLIKSVTITDTATNTKIKPLSTGAVTHISENMRAYTIKVPNGDFRVDATFKANNSAGYYGIELDITGNGSAIVYNGDEAITTPVARKDNSISLRAVKGGSGYGFDSSKYYYTDSSGRKVYLTENTSFAMPASDIVIHLEFAQYRNIDFVCYGGVAECNTYTNGSVGDPISMSIPGKSLVVSGYRWREFIDEYSIRGTTASGKTVILSKNSYGYSFTMPNEDVTFYLTFRKASYSINTSAENGSVSYEYTVPTADNSGATVKLTAKADKGYFLSKMYYNYDPGAGYESRRVNLDISDPDNITFVTPQSDVTVYAEFESCPVITIDLGDLGSPIKYQVEKGENFYEALENAGAWNRLNDMENSDYIFRELTPEPLSEYNDSDAYSDAAYDLLNSTVTGSMTVYAGFYTKIKSVELTVDTPEAGDVVTIENDIQTPAPSVTLGENAHCALEAVSEWMTFDGENYSSLEGAFASGGTYYVDAFIIPDFGYWLDDDTVVTVNGGTLEESCGRMALSVYFRVDLPSDKLARGDVNGDGIVNISDATEIQRYVARLISLSDKQLEAADVDGDGKVTINDATMIQKYIAHMIHEL